MFGIKFGELIVGDKVIVTNFKSVCREWTIWEIVKYGSTWHFFIKRELGMGVLYQDFCVHDLEYTRLTLDNGDVVYINGDEFVGDCNSVIDNIRGFKAQMLNKS